MQRKSMQSNHSRNSATKALVLAAGVGTRLDPLTKSVPKPLVPVGNRPVMEHVLRLLKRHNINDVSANLHYMADMIPAYFENVKDLGQSLHFVKEETLSGDAGGMRACKAFLKDSTFVVLMGDIITDIDLSFVVNKHKRSGAVASIALKTVDDVQHFGVARLNNEHRIVEFQEKPKPEEAISNLASTGIYVFEPEIFDYVPNNGTYMFGNELFPKLLRMGVPINGIRVLGHWSDIGTINTYRQTSFDAINGNIDIDMPANHYDPYTHRHVDVEGSFLLGRNCQVSAGVKVRGNVIVGDNCTIGPGVTLEDTIIWPNSKITADAVLRGSIVGNNCVIPAGTFYEEATVVQQKTAQSAPDLPSKLARLRQSHADQNGYLGNSRVDRSA
jgi:mannose-1-phosphate guanylyltransferase